MAKSKSSGRGFLIGLVVGIAVGAAVTLVLTPRPTVAQPADPSGVRDGEDAPATGDPLAAVVDRVRERYQDALIQGREVYERTRAEVLARYNQARSQ